MLSNNRYAGDWRRHRGHYYVTVMELGTVLAQRQYRHNDDIVVTGGNKTVIVTTFGRTNNDKLVSVFVFIVTYSW